MSKNWWARAVVKRRSKDTFSSRFQNAARQEETRSLNQSAASTTVCQRCPGFCGSYQVTREAFRAYPPADRPPRPRSGCSLPSFCGGSCVSRSEGQQAPTSQKASTTCRARVRHSVHRSRIGIRAGVKRRSGSIVSFLTSFLNVAFLSAFSPHIIAQSICDSPRKGASPSCSDTRKAPEGSETSR